MIGEDLRPLHRLALTLADGCVARVGDADLVRPTSCRGWDLGALLAHMIGQHRGFAAAVRNGMAPASAYRPVPFSRQAWQESVVDLGQAFADADLDGLVNQVELSPAPLPVRRVLGAQLLDTVVHTWDVASALGEPFAPPPELVQTVAALVDTVPDTARGPGRPFGPALALPADPWQRTLALLGRDPDTAPSNQQEIA